MLSNAYFDYFLASFRFDTAENEPNKNLQSVAKKIANFARFANTQADSPEPGASAFMVAGAVSACEGGAPRRFSARERCRGS